MPKIPQLNPYEKEQWAGDLLRRNCQSLPGDILSVQKRRS